MLNITRLLFCLFILSVYAIQTDLIINGDFSYNLCLQTYCSWNTSKYDLFDVYGWIPDPEIHIAQGNLFNSSLGNKKVLYLPGKRYSCVKQIFDALKIGSYTLNIHYAAHKISDQQKSSFSIHFNEIFLKTISPSTNQFQNQSIQFKLESLTRNVELKLCGEANSGSSGSVLTKVELLGESQTSLRKEDPVISMYHLLPLKKRSSRLLAIIPSTDFNPSSATPTIKTLISQSVPTNLIPTAISTIPVNAPTSSTESLTAPTLSTASNRSEGSGMIRLQLPTVEIPTTNNLVSSMASTANNVVSSTASALNSMNILKPQVSVKPAVVNVSAITNIIVKNGSSVSSNSIATTENSLDKQKISSSHVHSKNALKTAPASNEIHSTSSDFSVSSNGIWTEKKSSINTENFKIGNGWSSDSNCSKKTQILSTANPTWTEKKASSDLSLNSATVSGWQSNSQCNKQQGLESKITQKGEKKNSLNQNQKLPLKQENQSKPNNIKTSENSQSQNIQKASTLNSPWVENQSSVNLNNVETKDESTSNSKYKENSDKVQVTEKKGQNNTQGLSVEGLKSSPSVLAGSLLELPTDIGRSTNPQPVSSPSNGLGNLTNSQMSRPLITSSFQPIPATTSSTPLISSPVPTAPNILASPLSNLIGNLSTTSSKPLLTSTPTPVLTPLQSLTPNPASASGQPSLSATVPAPVVAPTPTPTLTPSPRVQNHIIEQIITKPLSESEKNINLISNGGFETNKCQSPPCLINPFIPGSSLDSWIAEPYIEIGLVKNYNPSLKTSSNKFAAHLGFSSKNACIKQSLKSLTNQFYDLSFDYSPVLFQNSDAISQAFFIVKFNGRNVKNVLCIEKSLQRQNIVVKGIKGENIIQFCAFGSGNENPHGVIIDNVALIVKSDLETLKTDFIVNGDFQNNLCYSRNCIWNNYNFDQKDLVGWLPEPEIEIGKGNVYNVHAGISTVAELSPNSNSCIKQVIENCVAGSFNLQFSWAARESEMLHDSIFQVKMNDKLIKSFIPNDYMMHRENVVLNLKEGRNELMFCSFGMNNNKGAIIDDVSMFLIESCQSA